MCWQAVEGLMLVSCCKLKMLALACGFTAVWSRFSLTGHSCLSLSPVWDLAVPMEVCAWHHLVRVGLLESVLGGFKQSTGTAESCLLQLWCSAAWKPTPDGTPALAGLWRWESAPRVPTEICGQVRVSPGVLIPSCGLRLFSELILLFGVSLSYSRTAPDFSDSLISTRLMQQQAVQAGGRATLLKCFFSVTLLSSLLNCIFSKVKRHWGCAFVFLPAQHPGQLWSCLG